MDSSFGSNHERIQSGKDPNLAGYWSTPLVGKEGHLSTVLQQLPGLWLSRASAPSLIHGINRHSRHSVYR